MNEFTLKLYLHYRIDLSVPSYMNRHSISINGKNKDITREDLAKELEINPQLIQSIASDFVRI